MNESKKSLLRKNMIRNQIIQDLEVNDILDELYSKEVINNDEKEQISTMDNRKMRVGFLLDILYTKKNGEVDKFVEALKETYSWLSDLFEKIGCVNEEEYRDEVYERALLLGDIPQLPENYVPRVEQQKLLRSKLEKLERGKYVGVHGMVGYGKSVLAVSVLRDRDLVHSCFGDCLYFVAAGPAKTKLDAGQLLYRLYVRVRADYNRDIAAPVHFDQTFIDSMRDHLKVVFLENQKRDALIILDDVCCKDVIDVFNFGCKTLITTQDSTVWPSQLTDVLELKTGFTEEESLSMLSSCVNEEIDRLPVEARRLHHLYKGAPLFIALIGADIGEWGEEAKKKERWKEYVSMMVDKKDSSLAKAYKIFFRRKKKGVGPSSGDEQIFNTIKHRLENLSKNYQDYYRHFALFVEDVNITLPVVQVMLNKKAHECVEILGRLKHKSLIVSAFNKELDSYVYGIHDLLLAHLKQTVSDEDRMNLHRKFLKNYMEIAGGDYSKLPNDNYIYTYIGYHLVEAKYFHLFSELYFNLDFLEAKIKHVGVAFLIGDFKRYRNFITKNNDPTLSEKLDSFEQFLHKFGPELYRYESTDIIQCALQQMCSDVVHDAALEVAQLRCDRTLYLLTQCVGRTLYETTARTLDVDEDVHAVCFAHHADLILVGTASGDVQMWDQSYRSRLCRFRGHTAKVTRLELAADDTRFLSVSNDGSVRIWDLDKYHYEHLSNGVNNLSLSPPLRQGGAVPFFVEASCAFSREHYTIANDEITAASFSHDTDAFYLVTGTKAGLLSIWDRRTGQSRNLLEHTAAITCCSFTDRDTVIAAGSEGVIFLYDRVTGEYLSQVVGETPCTNFLLAVREDDQCVVAVGSRSVRLLRWTARRKETGGVWLYDPRCSIIEERKDTRYTCAAITWDGLYLVLGSTDHHIYLWSLRSQRCVRKLVDNHGLIISLDTFLNERSHANVMYILLTGSNEKTVKHWHIEEPEIRPISGAGVTTRLRPQFGACWPHGGAPPLVAVITDTQQLRAYNGHTLLTETDSLLRPEALTCHPNGHEIAVGLVDGKVFLFDVHSRRLRPVLDLEGPPNYLEYLNHDMLVAASNNGCLMARTGSKTIRLKQPQNKISPRTSSSPNSTSHATIKCFTLDTIKDSFVTIEDDKTVKIWYLNGIKNVLVARDPNAMVASATVDYSKTRLAMVLIDGRFKLYDIQINSDENVVTLDFNHGHEFNVALQSCCFTRDGKLLALGQESGDIVIWDVVDQEPLMTLKTHKTAVKDLIFSPNLSTDVPLVLVSVGDQIVWWDVTPIRLKRTNRRRASGRRSSTNPPSLHLSSDSNLDWSWTNKEGRSHNKHVLAAVRTTGEQVTRIHASPDFTCFVTVDSSGALYVMNVLKPC